MSCGKKKKKKKSSRGPGVAALERCRLQLNLVMTYEATTPFCYFLTCRVWFHENFFLAIKYSEKRKNESFQSDWLCF